MRPTLRRCQRLENGTGERWCAPGYQVCVTAEKARRRSLKDAGDRAQRPPAQLHVGMPFEVVEETGVHASLAGEVFECQSKFPPTMGDPSSQISGLDFHRSSVHAASVRF
jgi:hypothetical protein